jgi:glutamine synthetase
VTYRAEYLWIDGNEPTTEIRSKTKIIPDGGEVGIWGFDGSSTNQATGDRSDCILRPVFTCPDPLRADGDILVLCDVYSADGSAHPTNTRAACAAAEAKHKAQEAWYGMEQEYTLMKGGRPAGFPDGGYPGPQGPYYCGTGSANVVGRELIEEHLEACIMAGLKISGINAEVMPGQWEFQIGPAGPTEVGDHMYIARYLLCRMAESYGFDASFEAKPAKGDWNGAGCHSNFSTKAMREPGGWDVIIAACEKLGQPEKIKLHIANYGHDIESRLTGKHETCSYKEFKYGVSDRGASIRIPLATKLIGYGYFEDRRPNANMDPYTVARLLLETTCE